MFSSIHAVLSLSRLVTPLKETKGAWSEDTGVVPGGRGPLSDRLGAAEFCMFHDTTDGSCAHSIGFDAESVKEAARDACGPAVPTKKTVKSVRNVDLTVLVWSRESPNCPHAGGSCSLVHTSFKGRLMLVMQLIERIMRESCMTNAQAFTADARAHTLARKLYRAIVARTCRRTDIGPAYGTNKAVVVLAAI